MSQERVTSDDGFTLIELLMSISISVIVLSGLVGMFITMLPGNDSIATRVTDATGGQQLAVTLPTDLQSTFPNQIDTNSATPSGCADTAGSNVVQLTWQQATWDSNQVEGAPVKFVASYRVVSYTTDKGVSATKLLRYYCSGTDPSTVSAEVRPIADGLTAIGSTPAPAAAAVSGGTVTITTTSLGGAAYTYVLTPRTAPAGGSPGSPPPTQPPSPTPSPAPPSVKSIVMKDVDHDGYVDEVDVSLTKAPQDMSKCATNAAWSLSNAPSSGAEGTVTGTGTSIAIGITPNKSKAQDTAVGSFSVSFSPPTGCDVLALTNAPPTDSASPVVTDIESINVKTGKDKGTEGRMEPGDALAITFSEALAPLTATTGSATETSTSGNSRLNISGITAGGALDTGGVYVRNTPLPSAAPSISATYSLSGAVLTVTLTGSTCNPTADCLQILTGQGALAFTPAASLTDASSQLNPANGTYTSPATFKLF